VGSLGGEMTENKVEDLDFYIENFPEIFSKEDIVRNYIELSKHHKEMMKSNESIIKSKEEIIKIIDESYKNILNSNEIRISKERSKIEKLLKGKKNLMEYNKQQKETSKIDSIRICAIASELLKQKKRKSTIVSLIEKKTDIKRRKIYRALKTHPSKFWAPKDKK
jgi:UDP-N-acetylmuramyl pentapeptide synthase